jgi:GTP cyclohydrolase II
MLTTTPAESTRTDLDYIGHCALPTAWGEFCLYGFLDPASGKEHLAITLGTLDDGVPVLARLHSECLTGDALFSQRCDCGAQLAYALKSIAEHGRGVVLYLRQEGRGIGLLNKIRAYQLQDAGADTVEANELLGFEADLRDYAIAKPMFDTLGVSSVMLMTNNPQKVDALQSAGIHVHERRPIIAGHCASNQRYLKTKQEKLAHLLPPA